MTFVGGKLSLKGDKKKSKKSKKKKSKHSHRSKEDGGAGQEAAAAAATAAAHSDDDDDDMTEAERNALKFKLEAEKKDLAKAVKQTHRERVEEFSQKLSELTELNDIPRVSAAGNG